MEVAHNHTELLSRISAAGWTLNSLKQRGREFVAVATSPSGDKAERVGGTPKMALANLISYIDRANRMAPYKRAKTAAWATHWINDHERLADAYRKLPLYDEKAVPAWRALAEESKAQADELRRQIEVIPVGRHNADQYGVDPERPYKSPEDLRNDIRNKRMFVSTENVDHPVWTPDDVANFRTVHNVLGVGQSNSPEYSWRGANMAFQSHAPYLSPDARKALFSEIIGQGAHHRHFRTFSEPRIALMDEHLMPAEDHESHHSVNVTPTPVAHAGDPQEPGGWRQAALGEGPDVPSNLDPALLKRAIELFDIQVQRGEKPLSTFMGVADQLISSGVPRPQAMEAARKALLNHEDRNLAIQSGPTLGDEPTAPRGWQFNNWPKGWTERLERMPKRQGSIEGWTTRTAALIQRNASVIHSHIVRSAYRLANKKLDRLADKARAQLLKRPDVVKWLESNPKRKDNLEHFFNSAPSEAYKLYPWMWTQVKNGPSYMTTHAEEMYEIGKVFHLLNRNNKPTPDIHRLTLGAAIDWLKSPETERLLGDLRPVPWEDPEHHYTASDGKHVVHRITNAEDATREGELMGHCVGDYGDRIERGDTNIFSLRDEKHRPHVTIEMQPVDDSVGRAHSLAENLRPHDHILVGPPHGALTGATILGRGDEWGSYKIEEDGTKERRQIDIGYIRGYYPGRYRVGDEVKLNYAAAWTDGDLGPYKVIGVHKYENGDLGYLLDASRLGRSQTVVDENNLTLADGQVPSKPQLPFQSNLPTEHKVTQVFGKGDQAPIGKYRKMVREFFDHMRERGHTLRWAGNEFLPDHVDDMDGAEEVWNFLDELHTHMLEQESEDNAPNTDPLGVAHSLEETGSMAREYGFDHHGNDDGMDVNWHALLDDFARRASDHPYYDVDDMKEQILAVAAVKGVPFAELRDALRHAENKAQARQEDEYIEARDRDRDHSYHDINNRAEDILRDKINDEFHEVDHSWGRAYTPEQWELVNSDEPEDFGEREEWRNRVDEAESAADDQYENFRRGHEGEAMQDAEDEWEENWEPYDVLDGGYGALTDLENELVETPERKVDEVLRAAMDKNASDVVVNSRWEDLMNSISKSPKFYASITHSFPNIVRRINEYAKKQVERTHAPLGWQQTMPKGEQPIYNTTTRTEQMIEALDALMRNVHADGGPKFDRHNTRREHVERYLHQNSIHHPFHSGPEAGEQRPMLKPSEMPSQRDMLYDHSMEPARAVAPLKDVNGEGIVKGDLVRHPDYGVGTVTDDPGTGRGNAHSVYFEDHGHYYFDHETDPKNINGTPWNGTMTRIGSEVPDHIPVGWTHKQPDLPKPGDLYSGQTSDDEMPLTEGMRVQHSIDGREGVVTGFHGDGDATFVKFDDSGRDEIVRAGRLKRLGSAEVQQMLDANRGQNLQGLPSKPVNVRGTGPLNFHSHGGIQQIANEYNQRAGLGEHPTNYSPVNPEIAARVAQEYEQMQHAPNDPQVKAAYDALKRESMDQYQALKDAGYTFDFYPDGQDPYPNSPREAVLDLHRNKHMKVFPTMGANGGFGQEAADYPGHPLLETIPGETWSRKPVTYNDVFRAIHDVYGHGKEGLGFRAEGEDNAFRQHSAMFSPLAQRALTSETRGQNHWVNYGPHGEHNQTATTDTVYAPQKAGLLPEWVSDPDLHLRGRQASRTAMSLNPAAFAKYPRQATVEQVENIIGQWTNGFNTDLIPANSLLALQVVPLSQIRGGTTQSSGKWSGEDWDFEMASEHGYDEDEADDYYRELERVILDRGDVHPLILIRNPDGSYESEDGWHRASIARHLGFTEFPAYVYNPQAPRQAKIARDLAADAVKMIATSGASLNPHTLEPFSASSGYMVSHQAPTEVVAADAFNKGRLLQFQHTVMPYVTANDYLGGWLEDGKVFLDLSEHILDRKEALQRAIDNKQIAIWGWAEQESIYILDKDGNVLPEIQAELAGWRRSSFSDADKKRKVKSKAREVAKTDSGAKRVAKTAVDEHASKKLVREALKGEDSDWVEKVLKEMGRIKRTRGAIVMRRVLKR